MVIDFTIWPEVIFDKTKEQKGRESDTLWHVPFSFADGFHKQKIGRRKHRDLSTVASQQEARTLNLCQERSFQGFIIYQPDNSTTAGMC